MFGSFKPPMDVYLDTAVVDVAVVQTQDQTTIAKVMAGGDGKRGPPVLLCASLIPPCSRTAASSLSMSPSCSL